MRESTNVSASLCLIAATLITSMLFGVPLGEAAANLKVAAALPGIITDRSWVQDGYEGLKLIEKSLGAQIAYTEKVAQPDQVEVMSDYARRGYGLIFAHGGEFDAAAKEVAARFPGTRFVVTNGRSLGPNLASVTINHFQSGFLAGVTAGMMSRTNKVAVVAAQRFKAVDDWITGFQEGAKFGNSKVEVFVSFTGNWDDAGKAKEAALAQIGRGADVLFPILQLGTLGLLEAVKEKKVFAVGQVNDQLDLAPRNILTSAVEKVGSAWLHVAKLASDGKFEGKAYVIGLENPQAAHIGRYGSMVPARVKAKVEEAKKLLLAGKIRQK